MYKVFKKDQVLKKKLQEVEEKHFEETIKLKIAEKLKDDKEILSAKEKVQIIEDTLEVLNGL